MTDHTRVGTVATATPKIIFDVPHSARIWNYWLAGKDNYPVDQVAGDLWQDTHPEIVTLATQSRRFVLDAVGYLAGPARVRQFIDIGTGLPLAPNVHEAAQQVEPGCRVVYVDNAPLVLVHARALHTPLPGGAPVTVVDADVREPERILQSAGENLDLRRPVAVVLSWVLGHVGDDMQVRSIIDRLVRALPSTSYLVLCDATATHPHSALYRAAATYADSGAYPYYPRTPEQLGVLTDSVTRT